MAPKYFKLGILGYPLGYSLSPLIHTRALEAANLKGEYREYPVSPEDLWDWLAHVNDAGLTGFNVTMPYKKSVFAWIVGQGQGELGRIESADRQIGAINTVVLDRGRPIGYNTDGEGFLRTLTEPPRSLNVSGWHVLLLGAGGAAQAIAATLALRTKVKRLTIWNRHPEQARRLVAQIQEIRSEYGRPADFVESMEKLETLPVGECQLVINATSVGMKGQSQRLIDPAQLHKDQIVYDIVYEPRETALIQAARKKGCQVVTGDEMLAGQAAASFYLWTGVNGMLSVMRKALDDHFTDHR